MDQNTKDVLMILIPALSALGTLYVAAITARTKALVDSVAADVLRVEKATNSHTDLLVAATQRAAHAQGKQEERNERRTRDKQEMKSPENP